MYRFGLKLWSINKNYIQEAVRLYEKGVYQYIELFAVVGSYKKYISLWKDLQIPYVVHAPHSLGGGLNLAKKELRENNFKLAKESFMYADALNAPIVIFHPGFDGNIKETVTQLKMIKDNRIVVENKPYETIFPDKFCNGFSVSEISFVLAETGVGFCLDFGHAICAANSSKLDPYEHIGEFNKLNPKMYHLSNKKMGSCLDEHLHLRDGDYDLKKFLKNMPNDSIITIETDKKLQNNLEDFENDIIYLISL